MLRYTKSALGLLGRQYCSVLKKCGMLNLAAIFFALPALANDNPLAPINAPVVQVVTTNMNNHLYTAIENQLGARSLGHKIGYASGDMMKGMTLWTSGYYGKAKLDNRQASKGFDVDSIGGIVGVEKQMSEHMKIGAGYQYDSSDVDGYKRKNDAKSSTGFIYAQYRPNAMFVNAIASYGQSTYRVKNNMLPITVKSKYHADMYGLQGLTGYEYAWNAMNITPQMGLRYNYIARHGYNAANQQISGKNMDIFTGILGVKMSKDLYWHECLKFRPELYGGMTYDFVSNRDNAVVMSADGSNYAVDGKRLNRMGFQIGAGMTSELTERLSLNLSYLGNFRQDFHDNSGLIGLSYEM